MSKLHKKTAGTCLVCEEPIHPDLSVCFHKTRRQTHRLCMGCAEIYLTSPLKTMIDNLRRNIRKDIQFVRCPGSIHCQMRNQCRQRVDIVNITVPEESKLSTDIFRIKYILSSPTAYICPNKDCNNVVDVDQTYESHKVVCVYCKTSWCRQCLLTPYHEGKTCLEVEIAEQKSENAKFIWEMSRQGKIKFCPTCKSPTYRPGGCNKMYCNSCGSKWCWLCGEKIYGYDHFNSRAANPCADKLWEGT